MFKRIRIRNYRILNDLEIPKLGRFNLFAGLNNSGKSSLLESVFLLTGGGNPQLIMTANQIRGFDPSIGVLANPREPWKELFYNLDKSRNIEITGNHDMIGKMSLQIAMESAPTTEIPLDPSSAIPMTNVPETSVLTFRYDAPRNTHAKGYIRASGSGFDVSHPTPCVPFVSAIISSRVGNAQEDAKRLGILRTKKKSGLLLAALRDIDPDLQSIEDSVATGTPLIWVDVGLAELVPLSAMGESMTRIARLVLAISTAEGGVILVDEIENGFHHSVLPKVWKAVEKASIQSNTQVFATTHSRENIIAASESLAPDSLFLHRLEVHDSLNSCITYESESLKSAIKHDIEVH